MTGVQTCALPIWGRYACSRCPLTVFIYPNGLSRFGNCPTLTKRQDDATGATQIHERDAIALLFSMWIQLPRYPFSHLPESHRYYIVVLNIVTERHSDPLRLKATSFNLFGTVRATDEQADYPLLYASAKPSWALDTLPTPSTDPASSMTPLFELILKHVPPPSHLDRTAPFSILTVQIESGSYVWVLLLGRVHSGILRLGDTLWA